VPASRRQRARVGLPRGAVRARVRQRRHLPEVRGEAAALRAGGAGGSVRRVVLQSCFHVERKEKEKAAHRHQS
jgi:hypothetical protein